MTDLHIPLDTPRDKLEIAIDAIRQALDNHEGMTAEHPPRVFFNEFNPESFNIRVMYWYSPPNYWDFLAFTERLNLHICRVFSENGIRFSLPLRVAHTSIESEETPVEVKVSEGHITS